MDLSPFFLYVLPILTVLAVGLLGSTRRIGFWLAIILSVVLTPIGGFLVALISGPKRRKRRHLPQKAASKAATADPSVRA
jgi:UPF0716 family protein affecting phage T7 exclusion